MPLLKIKQEEYNIALTKNSFNRRATHYTNNIIEALKRLGINEDDIEVKEERLAIKKAPATASWWVEDEHCHYSYTKMDRYVDNLQVIMHVIKRHIEKLANEEISIEEFINTFKEKGNIQEQRKAARTYFELDEHHTNLEEVNKKYKQLAKTLHPDMPTGDVEKFKALNEHHKTLKRELE